MKFNISILFLLFNVVQLTCMESEDFQHLFTAIEQNNPKPLQEKKRILSQVIDKDGNTLLHKAVACENFDMVQELLRLAPTLKNKPNKKQKTPKEITSSPEIIRLLK